MIPQRRYRRNARTRLNDLLWQQRYACWWCGRLLVRLAALAQSDIIKETPHMVTWRDGEDVLEAHIATVDHLIELSNGGKTIGNLVASCLTCNNRRSRQPKSK